MTTLPEEVLEQIIALVLPHVHILQVSKAFNRITTPLLYRHLHLRTSTQAQRVAEAVLANPERGQCVRTLRVDGPFPQLLVVASALSSRPLEELDVLMDRPLPQPPELDFIQALKLIPDVKHLVIRKAGFLTSPDAVHAIPALAEGVYKWSSLTFVNFKYKISPLPPKVEYPPLPPHFPPKPSTIHDPLAAALSCAPALISVTAQSPTLFNTFLSDVATNPSLRRIELVAPDTTIGSQKCRTRTARTLSVLPKCDTAAIRDTNRKHTPDLEAALKPPLTLYTKQAAKDPHLYALILAGQRHMLTERMRFEDSVAILRGRAHTVVPMLETGELFYPLGQSNLKAAH